MKNKLVLYDKKDTIGQISFNCPENLNCITQKMGGVFQEILNQIKEDRQLRCLIITGSGTTFCGGADLKSGFEKNRGPLLNEFLMDFYNPFLDIGRLKIPVIAAMNGHAIGGGLGIALMCDIRVADRQAKLGANLSVWDYIPAWQYPIFYPGLWAWPKQMNCCLQANS